MLSYQELDILHALRGFCAFYVVIYHAKFVLWSGGTEFLKVFPRAGWHFTQYVAFAADMLSSAGYEMVIFFFVLSGFFIRYAQLRKHRPALQFYINRVVRIYPPYVASLVLAAGVLSYLAHSHSALLTAAPSRELNAGLLGAWRELQALTLSALSQALLFLKLGEYYVGYNIVYWSLLPEALFYLLVPLAFWRPRFYYAFSAACYAVGLLVAALHIRMGLLGSFVLTYNGYFALGAGLYDVITVRPNWLVAFRKINGIRLALLCALLMGLLIGMAALQLKTWSGPPTALLAVLSITALVAGRVERQNLLVRIFHKVGVFSFSLYLYHFPLLILSYAALVTFTGNLVNYARYYWLTIPFVTAGCFALYYITERLAVRFFREI